MNLLICGPNASSISGISNAIFSRYIRKNPRSMYARVPQMMAQFVLKIELLSHIIGTAPILEMARAYGLRPRLWLLIFCKTHHRIQLFLALRLSVRRFQMPLEGLRFVQTLAAFGIIWATDPLLRNMTKIFCLR